MKLRAIEPGFYVSAAAHAALLTFALVSFSSTPKFTDAQETIAVDMISESQFNEVMKGVRDAKLAETPKPVVDRVADEEVSKPNPTVNEAKVDVPAPPPPLRRDPEPAPEPEPAPPPPPPQQVAALPPEPAPSPEPAPEPPKPAPPETRPEPPRAEPKPAPKPEPAKPEPPKPVAQAIDAPRPPPRPRNLPQRPAEKPAPPRELKPDRIAALLEKRRREEQARPPAGREAQQQRRFDPNSIAQLLSKEEPGQRASTGRTVNQTASLGSPNASGQRMSPSMWGQLDGYLIEQYKRCWSYIPLGPTARYMPQIEVSYTASGALAREPRLRNQPSDPALRTLAESAMRAVRQCNPLRIPAQFQPYYNEWKDRILRFDPDEMYG